jgi:hypothetical protein
LINKIEVEINIEKYFNFKTITYNTHKSIKIFTNKITITYNYIIMSSPSLCIPRVFSNIGWKRIKDTIEEAGWGSIQRVDVIPKKNDNGDTFNRVFVHFNKWNTDKDEIKTIVSALEEGESIKMTYDEPWFWVIRKSNVPRPDYRIKQKKTMKPKIDLTETSDTDGKTSSKDKTKKTKGSSTTQNKNVSKTIKMMIKKDTENTKLIRDLMASVHTLTEEVKNLKNGTTSMTQACSSPPYAPASPPYVPDSPSFTRAVTKDIDEDLSYSQVAQSASNTN